MGEAAARVGDLHTCPMADGLKPHVGGPIAPTGCLTVLIGGQPAARAGDLAICVGPPDTIAKGSSGVFIGGKPAARKGDTTVHGGEIRVGLTTVLIGETGSGGASAGTASLSVGQGSPGNPGASAIAALSGILGLLSDKVAGVFYSIKSELVSSNQYKTKPNLSDLLSDPKVDAELREAWYESNPHAAEVPSGQAGSKKKEQGGFIYWNKKSGHLEVERFPAGKRDGITSIPPVRNTADRELVGAFHSHPNKSSEGYSSSPSPADRAFTKQSKVPHIIESHDGRKTIPYP